MADPAGGTRRPRLPLALVRPPTPSLVRRATLTFLPRQEPDFSVLRAQHERYVAALTKGGFQVRSLPPLPSFPDATFVEDLGVGLSSGVILGRGAAPARAGELEATFTDHGHPGASSGGRDSGTVELALPFPGRLSLPLLGRIVAPGTLDGGDVLVLGRQILVGRSTRTNAEGRKQLAGLVAPLGYDVVPVRVRGALHLKTAVTAVDDGTVIMNPAWVSSLALDGLRIIPVAEDEPFAANVLPLPDGTVLMSTSAPRTAASVEGQGHRVRRLEISEFEKGEGGLTCLSLRIPGSDRPGD